jgi:hypothetical protein
MSVLTLWAEASRGSMVRPTTTSTDSGKPRFAAIERGDEGRMSFANAHKAVGAIALVAVIDWPPDAVTMRVLDADDC